MTTAVDTNVLLDVFTQDAKFCTRSAAALRTALKAETQADCLLTRDRGFYRSYFSELRVVAPPEI